MIRKAHHTNMSAADPTPEQIRERTAAIRQTWTPRERARRSGIKHINWLPPLICELDLPGHSANEFDSN
jgi:hypothetical protein